MFVLEDNSIKAECVITQEGDGVYELKNIAVLPDCQRKGYGKAFRYGNFYFRIDEVLFPEKPFIVLECTSTIEDVMNNIMEDGDPFPYDLSDREVMKEVRYSLGIEPYPNS